MRLLLVDDDPLLLKSLSDTLQADGHVVVGSNGGAAGITAFREAKAAGVQFGAVITDLGMPNVDGRMVAAAIKEASHATPVIMLTGWGRRLLSEEDFPAHVDYVLSKPPKLRELRETLVLCSDASAREQKQGGG
jgi:DNA-binding response OmpR family regulator